MDKTIVIDTPEGIQFAQLAAVKGALRLESLGMRHSKLGKIRKGWAVRLGLKPSTKYPELIAHIQKLMDGMIAAKAEGG